MALQDNNHPSRPNTTPCPDFEEFYSLGVVVAASHLKNTAKHAKSLPNSDKYLTLQAMDEDYQPENFYKFS
jgi:hypothetical protein